MAKANNELDLKAIRAKLKSADGRTYWRGLEQLAETDDFTKWLEDEFPERKSLLEIDRRSMLKLMGASLALAGIAGCRSLPQERVIPFAKSPEDRPPGATLYYASAIPFGGYGFPVLVESHEGRPTKFEGNPDHPASGGASDAITQASILGMYDPDRLKDVENKGSSSSTVALLDTWEHFFAVGRETLDAEKAGGGAGIRILTGPVTSPTLARMLEKFLAAYPNATWHQYEPANRDSQMAGMKLAFGEFVQPIYDFSQAKAVLSLDGDFMATNPHTVKYARDFSATRDLNGSIGRLYSVESTPSLTGAFADHRAPVSPTEVLDVALAVATKLGIGAGAGKLPAGVTSKWIDAVAADLQSGGLVYAGDHQAPEVHALAAAINAKIAAPVTYVEMAEARPTLKTPSLDGLTKAINAGKVKTLIILGGNPVYSAPGDIRFGLALPKVPLSIYLGEAGNETSKECQWVLPEAHFLEAWGDLRSLDGTTTIVQPLIEPLYAGKSAIEVIAGLLRDTRTGEEIVRETWATGAYAGLLKINGEPVGEQVAWEKVLNDGFVQGSASAPKTVTAALAPISSSTRGKGLYAVFVPDPTIWDGAYANNGWLQELPKPLTKMTWDNAVYISPAKAEELGVNFQDMVNVTANGASVKAAVFVQPGHPDNSATLHMGYGRTEGGKVLKGTGFDFMPLRSSRNPGFSEVQLEKVAGSYPMSTAQLHHSMEGRDIIREGSVAKYRSDQTLAPEDAESEDQPTLYNLTEEWKKTGYPQWGMSIDLNLCVGCNACVSACQAENNIPTVGKIEVSRGREMHWIRIDRYYRVKEGEEVRDVGTDAAGTGAFESPVQVGKLSKAAAKDVLDSSKIETVFQPIPCMHCETAPCEPVCPVAATTHSHEGLNQMVYNRCVGTRYCSNNCPYKVRRFNFYNYQHGQKDVGLNKDYGQRNFQGEEDKPLLRLLHNPDVTVRSRGVMEKCTYCVQRINEARINAKKENRDMKDGEVITACQQVCPTRAITFGNVADPGSAVSLRKKEKRNYSLLQEVNTRPRTTYLGRVRNPHPDLENA